MKMSRRAKRMKSHHARSKDSNASLNMVSLMDIFTILVFFLLVNASSSEVLPTPKNVILPDSSAEKTPVKNLVVAINNDEISLQGQFIIKVSDALNSKSKTIEPLFKAIKEFSKKDKELKGKKGITIMGDKNIPYKLLKKVMLTGAGAGFGNLSFAVNQKAGQ